MTSCTFGSFLASSLVLVMGWAEWDDFPTAYGNKAPESSSLGQPDGIPLPKRARFRLGTSRFQHQGAVFAVAWSPDGKVLASAGHDRTVQLWQSPGGKKLWSLRGHPGEVLSLAFSPDGRQLVSGGNQGGMRLWDLARGKEIRCFGDPKGIVYRAVFSPDGKLIAAAGPGRDVHLYAADTGKEIRSFSGNAEAVLSLAFSPDGIVLGAGDNCGEVWCWEIGTGKRLKKFEVGKGVVYSLAFSPSGTRLASAVGIPKVGSPPESVGTVGMQIWDWPGGSEIAQLKAPGHNPFSLAFSPDGKVLATSGEDNSIHLWDVSSGKQLRRLDGLLGWGRSLVFSPDGKQLASGSEDGMVLLWGLHRESLPDQNLSQRIAWFAQTPDGKSLLTSALDGTLSLWDAGSGHPLRDLAHLDHPIGELSLAPDGRRLAFCDGGPLSLVELRTGQRTPLRGSPLHVECAVFSPLEDLVALGLADGNVEIRSSTTGALVCRCSGPDREEKLLDTVWALAWAADGRALAAANGQGQGGIWDSSTGRLRVKLRDEPGFFRGMAFSPDGRLLAAAGSGPRIRLWEVLSGQEVRQFRGHTGCPRALAFSPDGRTLASAITGEATWAPLPGGFPRFVPRNLDDYGIRLWSVGTGEHLQTLPGHAGFTSRLAFSPDGTALVSGSADGTVLSWDVADVTGRRSVTADLSPARLATLWAALGDERAGQAQQAVHELTRAPGVALPFLARSLTPLQPVPVARLEALIADLNHEEFGRREKASQELAKLDNLAEPALRKAFKAQPSPEVKRRLKQILDTLDGPLPSPEWARTSRALQVLEVIGTPESKEVLEKLAKGAAEARLTQEAKASLQRLSRRPRSSSDIGVRPENPSD